ncbi:MAG: pyrrolo-quinoline quinone [Acidobacteria bacterium]|nr:MAG: pyrrolo-quinoline quinone [Acidobacteriota bacterium]
MTPVRFGWFACILTITALLPAYSQSAGQQQTQDWAAYGGDQAKTHYSTLAQINKSNVKRLEVAWSFDTEETGGLQSSPIEVAGVLYGISPTQKIFALHAATGKLKWKFDSGIVGTQPDRGLSYWASPDNKDRRIIVGVMNFVYALDADTGRPIPSFGDHGRVDLREGLGRDVATGFIALTSPAVIYKDLFIVGGRLPETLPALPGDIRAYDARTGKQRWSFHTIPHPGEFGYDTWPKEAWQKSGGANNWTGMTVDQKTGILYVPTGSATFDFYGGDRLGDNLFADCELALNAETGERIWHFQGVHHDIWDRDFPSPPALVTVTHEGTRVDAVVQTTKQGFVYVFDRATGKPLFPVESHKYPPSDLPGEVAAAEQPLPTKPAPYARQRLTEDMLTNRTPEAHQWALEQFRTFRSEGQFVPLSTKQNLIIFPGFDGGAEWGGPAFDPESGILYVNSNEMAWAVELAQNKADPQSGKGIYQSQCTICHRDDMKGSPPLFPSLLGVHDRMTQDQIKERIQKGKGRMPGFPNLTPDEVNALVLFVSEGENKEISGQPVQPQMGYRFSGYTRFLESERYPAIAPPWGTLNAINLNTGEYAWKIPFGEYPELAGQGIKNTGSENYGGPIVTAGGLLFIGATNYDKKFRVFDKSTGELLWETTLPFSGNATPITYQVNGKQYVVIAAGGGKDVKSPSGGVYVAFALKGSE